MHKPTEHAVKTLNKKHITAQPKYKYITSNDANLAFNTTTTYHYFWQIFVDLLHKVQKMMNLLGGGKNMCKQLF